VLWVVKATTDSRAGRGEKKIPFITIFYAKGGSYSNFIMHLRIKLTGGPKTGF